MEVKRKVRAHEERVYQCNVCDTLLKEKLELSETCTSNSCIEKLLANSFLNLSTTVRRHLKQHCNCPKDIQRQQDVIYDGDRLLKKTCLQCGAEALDKEKVEYVDKRNKDEKKKEEKKKDEEEEDEENAEPVRKKPNISPHAIIVPGSSQENIDPVDPDLEYPMKPEPVCPQKSDESEFYDCRFLSNYFARKKELEVQASGCRKLWKKKIVAVATHIENMIAGAAGPDWFQDLSHLQMKLIDGLPAALIRDKKQGIVGGSQKLLFNLGVFPLVKSKILKKCIAESNGDPIKFLYLLHAEIAYLETEDYEREYFKAKRLGKRISPYSLNERLLFSAVFHVHYKTLLQKLDDILPPPVKPPKVLWAKKPKKPKPKPHPSPYMQPQPINEKCWYEERAETDLERKILKMKYAREQAEKKEKIKRELDLKEKDRKFQEQTDEMIKRAHSYEMKMMLNPRAPSTDSIQAEEKPHREDKLQLIERMYPPSLDEEGEEGIGEAVEVIPKTGIKRLDKLLENQTYSQAIISRYLTKIQAIEEKKQFYESKYTEIANRTPESTVFSKTPTESQIDEDDIEDEDDTGSEPSRPEIQGSDTDLERSDDISGVIESIPEEEEESEKVEESVSETKTDDNSGETVHSKKSKTKKVIEEDEESDDDEKPRMKVGKLMEHWLDLMDIVARPCDRFCDEIAAEKKKAREQEEGDGPKKKEEEELDEVDIFKEEPDNGSIVSDIVADLTEKGIVEKIPDGLDPEETSEDYTTIDEEAEAEEHLLDEEDVKKIFTFDYLSGEEEAEDEEHTSYEEELVDEENDPTSPEEYSSEAFMKVLDSCAVVQEPPKPKFIDKEMTVTKKKEKKLIKLGDLVDLDDDASTRGGKGQLMEEESEEDEEEETEGGEETEEEIEESKKKPIDYKYVMDIHADQQLNWFEKLKISKETITAKILSVDTSPQIPVVRAHPDAPDEELFQELNDDIAEETYLNYTFTRAVQTEPTELLCNFKEVIRPYKVRKPVEKVKESFFLDQESVRMEESPYEANEEEISNEEEPEDTEDTESPMADDGSSFSPSENLYEMYIPRDTVDEGCHYITNGFKDFELNIDPDTGEVVKELSSEELALLNLEREMKLNELRYGTPIFWLVDEHIKPSTSEIFQADKVVIENERFRIKAAFPPPHEETEEGCLESDNEDPNCKFSHKPLNVECTEQECGLIDDDELPMNEFVLARKMLAKIPADERLEAAIKYLGDKGDPLAILPELHHVPWLTRWYELRRGIRVKLTPEDKAYFMYVSHKLWENTGDRCDSVAVKAIDKSDLTWDNVEWVRKTSNRLLEKYHYGVKSTLVTNSRNYFPTMFCEYFNNPYMKRFRDAFFTYLPGRPNDAYTFRPWAKKEGKDNEYTEHC